MGVREVGAIIVGAVGVAVAAALALVGFGGEDGGTSLPGGAVESGRQGRASSPPNSAARHQPRTRRAAKALRPSPRKARKDRGRLHDAGCLVKPRDAKLERCVYGDRKSSTAMVLLGDSTVLQYGNAFLRLARKRDLRLVAHAKSGCTPASTPIYSRNLGRFYRECGRWRNRALRWIERKRPALVVISSSDGHKATAKGALLEGDARIEALEDGYVATLERVAAAGVKAAVMKDLPDAPKGLVRCVARKRKRPRRCAFPIPATHEERSFDRRAVARAGAATMVDLTPYICPRDRCRAVIGRTIVYRDPPHITGTFSRTLAGRIARPLPPAALPSSAG